MNYLVMSIGLILMMLFLLIGGCLVIGNKKEVPVIKERYGYECGPRCLQMISIYHGKNIEFDSITKYTKMSELDGTSLMGLSDGAKQIGLRSLGVKLPFNTNDLNEASLQEVPLPCIAHWNRNYFVVVTKINTNEVEIIHPRKGKLKFSKEEFIENWISETDEKDKEVGIVLILEKEKESK